MPSGRMAACMLPYSNWCGDDPRRASAQVECAGGRAERGGAVLLAQAFLAQSRPSACERAGGACWRPRRAVWSLLLLFTFFSLSAPRPSPVSAQMECAGGRGERCGACCFYVLFSLFPHPLSRPPVTCERAGGMCWRPRRAGWSLLLFFFFFPLFPHPLSRPPVTCERAGGMCWRPQRAGWSCRCCPCWAASSRTSWR